MPCLPKHKVFLDSGEVELLGKPRRRYYLYVYSREGVPFYVGVGTTGTGRACAHLVSAAQFMRRKIKSTLRKKIKITISIVKSSDSREVIQLEEKRYIAKYRKEYPGELANITSGGDGGDTMQGRKKYINPKTGECKVFHEGKAPKGWTRGVNHSMVGYVTYHNPNTLEGIRLPQGETPPKGFIKGGRPIYSGPTGKIIYHHKTTKKLRYVRPSEKLTTDWIKGRPNGSILGRTAYYCPKSLKKVYVEAGKVPPKGYVKGIHPTTGLKCKYKGRTYPSVQAAMRDHSITRGAVTQHSSFKLIRNNQK